MSRELEQLEKKSLFSLRVNGDLKDSVIQSYLNELNKVIKKEIKRKELVIIVMEK